MSSTARANGSKSKSAKPPKPYPEFPLFANGNGQWCKKIKGKPWYFGVWADPDAALQNYLDRVDDIRAGRDPKRQAQVQSADSVSVADVMNLYLQAQEERRKRGDITDRHFSDCVRSCRRAVKHFGRNVTAASLRAVDFAGYRKDFPDTWGTARISAEIARIRAVFRWAAESEVIPAMPNFGPDFKKPGTRVQRIERARRRAEHGRLDFSAEEIRELLKHSDGWLEACILLGINCGFGNLDCSSLRAGHVDFESGLYDLARAKTGIPRRSFLWKETLEAIRRAMDERPIAKSAKDDPLCFFTRRGFPLVNERFSENDTISKSDNVSTAFAKLLVKRNLKRPGRGFYSLRRTFETIAGATRDQPAVDVIMGHADASMAAVYRQGIEDERLTTVAQHVRQWLWTRECESCEASQFSVDEQWKCDACQAEYGAESE